MEAGFAAGTSPPCHVSDRDSQSRSVAYRRAWAGSSASIGPALRRMLMCLQMFSPKPCEPEHCQGKDKNAKASPEPRDGGKACQSGLGSPWGGQWEAATGRGPG